MSIMKRTSTRNQKKKNKDYNYDSFRLIFFSFRTPPTTRFFFFFALFFLPLCLRCSLTSFVTTLFQNRSLPCLSLTRCLSSYNAIVAVKEKRKEEEQEMNRCPAPEAHKPMPFIFPSHFSHEQRLNGGGVRMRKREKRREEKRKAKVFFNFIF